MAAFDVPQVAAAYGRQLPHANATPIAAHARLFNYPLLDHTVTAQDKAHKGIKTCFLYKSFAAFRLSALRQAGGFAPDLILGEDMHLASRLLLAGHASATKPTHRFIIHIITPCAKKWPATSIPASYIPSKAGS